MTRNAGEAINCGTTTWLTFIKLAASLILNPSEINCSSQVSVAVSPTHRSTERDFMLDPTMFIRGKICADNPIDSRKRFPSGNRYVGLKLYCATQGNKSLLFYFTTTLIVLN